MISEFETNFYSKQVTALSPSSDQPVGRWDFWDYRTDLNRAVITSNAYPPDIIPAIRYIHPHGQIWPR